MLNGGVDATIQANKELQDQHVESQRAPGIRSLACRFSNATGCKCGWSGFYTWFLCQGGRLWLGGTGLDLGVTGGGCRRSAFIRLKVGVLGFHFWTLRREDKVLYIPLHHLLLCVHGGFVQKFRLEVLVMPPLHGLLGPKKGATGEFLAPNLDW